MKLKKTIVAAVLSIGIISVSNTLRAQQMDLAPDIEVSDTELESFVDISIDLREIQQQIETEMLVIIDSSNMSQEKFMEIAKSYQMGNQDQTDFTENEMAKFQELSQQMQPLQMKSQQSAMQIIQNSEMGLERFQSIAGALQQDQALQQRYVALLQTKGN